MKRPWPNLFSRWFRSWPFHSSTSEERNWVVLTIAVTVMKMAEVYAAKAAEFDDLARRAVDASLKKRFMDMAESYRLLAKDRRRGIDDKKLDRKVKPQSD